MKRRPARRLSMTRVRLVAAPIFGAVLATGTVGVERNGVRAAAPADAAESAAVQPPRIAETRAAGNERLMRELEQVHGLSEAQMAKIRAVFAGSSIIGQGNPAITRHPMTREQCTQKLDAAHVAYANPRFERICGRKYMAPLYDPAKQAPEEAKACIDQFEFPDIPCEYPVVWVKAREAAEICAAEGKRLCDADEWEDACQGAWEPPDYRFDLAQGVPPEVGLRRMREAHNRAHAADERWSYGPQYERGVCATGSFKTPGCNGGSWTGCGSNTYPDGSFPACHSPLDVYDLNGNAAEHMNLPLAPDQMSQRGSTTLGYTEMKGSWFIFDTYRAHPDWCRWRAPFWHGTRVMDPHSHANYHLGFRCCSGLATSTSSPVDSPRGEQHDGSLSRGGLFGGAARRALPAWLVSSRSP